MKILGLVLLLSFLSIFLNAQSRRSSSLGKNGIGNDASASNLNRSSSPRKKREMEWKRQNIEKKKRETRPGSIDPLELSNKQLSSRKLLDQREKNKPLNIEDLRLSSKTQQSSSKLLDQREKNKKSRTVDSLSLSEWKQSSSKLLDQLEENKKSKKEIPRSRAGDFQTSFGMKPSTKELLDQLEKSKKTKKGNHPVITIDSQSVFEMKPSTRKLLDELKKNQKPKIEKSPTDTRTSQSRIQLEQTKKKTTEEKNRAPQISIQSNLFPDLDSLNSKSIIAQHNKRALGFTSTFLKKWNNDFDLFSPVGLYSMLGMLSLMAKSGSLSSTELKNSLNLQGQVLDASKMHVWSEYLIKKYNLVFANAFMTPTSPIPFETEFNSILKQSNMALENSVRNLNALADTLSQGQIKNIPLRQGPTKLTLVNIVMPRFTWLHAPTISSLQNYQFEKNGRLQKIQIRYMKHNVRTKFSVTKEYQACILPIVQSVQGLTKPLSVYIFSFPTALDAKKLGEMWTKIYHELRRKKDLFIDVFLPSAAVEQTIEFSKDLFPKLLRENNEDFTKIVLGSKWTLGLSQISKFCMDKNGVSTDSVPTSQQQETTTSSKMTFERPFYVVLANPDTEVPLFMAKVTEGRNSNLHSCPRSKKKN
ncbi:hypothetical protein HMI54_015061 [Coelomomyces lativittatus]|nr:hypothetical protein HMI56_007070 [Coelomomyces lativittatus]KAJ1513382.1 hypothetical protein HMI54_015061 [Coelomomyces lativittatus]KAJ1517304.1 hypothetical protein HMI55_000110 [Coelomomyces lativittatus]